MKSRSVFSPAVAVMMMIAFTTGVCEFAVVSILTSIAEGFGMTVTSAGILVSVFSCAYAVGTPFCAAAAGRFGRRRFLTAIMLLYALTNLICALTPLFPLFLIARGIAAVCCGSAGSAVMAMVKDTVSQEEAPTVISAIYTSMSVAGLIGMPALLILANLFGWRVPFLVMAVLGVIEALFCRALAQSAPERSESILRQFVILREKRILLGIGCLFFGYAGTYMVYTYLSAIFETMFLLPDGVVSMAMMACGAMLLISNIISGRIAQRDGMRRMPFVYAVSILCMLSMPFALQNVWTGTADLLLMCFLLYLVNSPSQIFFQRETMKTRPSCLGLASSFEMVFANLGITLGSFVGSMMADAFGIRFTGFGGAVFMVCALACAVMLQAQGVYRRTAGRKYTVKACA